MVTLSTFQRSYPKNGSSILKVSLRSSKDLAMERFFNTHRLEYRWFFLCSFAKHCSLSKSSYHFTSRSPIVPWRNLLNKRLVKGEIRKSMLITIFTVFTFVCHMINQHLTIFSQFDSTPRPISRKFSIFDSYHLSGWGNCDIQLFVIIDFVHSQISQ